MNDDGEGATVPEFVVSLPLDTAAAATVPVGLIVIVVDIRPFAPPPLSNDVIVDEFINHSFASGSTTAVSRSASHSWAGRPLFSEAAALELSPAISYLFSTAFSICSTFHIFCPSI